MRNIEKYQGIIPAFYACYDEKGEVDGERVQALTGYMVKKGVKGVYVGGSSGECIYQTVADRKLTLERVMEAAEGKLTVIAHVACNNTKGARSLRLMHRALGWMRLRLSRQFIFICRNMRLRSTGMIFPMLRLIRILLFIISRSWPG